MVHLDRQLWFSLVFPTIVNPFYSFPYFCYVTFMTLWRMEISAKWGKHLQPGGCHSTKRFTDERHFECSKYFQTERGLKLTTWKQHVLWSEFHPSDSHRILMNFHNEKLNLCKIKSANRLQETKYLLFSTLNKYIAKRHSVGWSWRFGLKGNWIVKILFFLRLAWSRWLTIWGHIKNQGHASVANARSSSYTLSAGTLFGDLKDERKN